MERPNNQHTSILFFSSIVFSGLISFVLCITAEFKKTKKSDLRYEGKLCYLPRSSAFELGIVGLISLTIAQVMGNLWVCRNFISREDTTTNITCCKTVKPPSSSCTLLMLSWVSYLITVILTSTATSMSHSQPFGEGWLDGECYIVKDGIYIGSALLGFVALGSTLGSSFLATSRQSRAHEKTEDSHTSQPMSNR